MRKPVSVLLVDDQPLFRQIASDLLAAMPEFDLAGEAANGEQAVALTEAMRPSLVVMDIRLPGLNGIEACRQIVRSNPDTTVVLVSTYHARDLPASARSCGAAAYVHKAHLGPTKLREIWSVATRGSDTDD